jgi:hypothetical protein
MSQSKKLTCKGTLRQVFICLSPPLHTVNILYTYSHREGVEGWGRVEPKRRLESQQFTKLGQKYQHMIEMYLQSINSRITQQNFSKFSPTNLNFVWEKLLCNTEFKQKVSEFSLPYDGSALKKCARFTEGVAEIRQPSKYRIILFENLRNSVIMLNLKISIPITNNATKFLKI